MTNVARCTPLQSLAVAHGPAAITHTPARFQNNLLIKTLINRTHLSQIQIQMCANIWGENDHKCPRDEEHSENPISIFVIWYSSKLLYMESKISYFMSVKMKIQFMLSYCDLYRFDSKSVLSRFTHFCVEQTFTWKSLSVEHKSKNDKYHASRFQNKTILENEVFDSAEKTTLFGPNVHTLKVFRKGKKSNVDIYIFSKFVNRW